MKNTDSFFRAYVVTALWSSVDSAANAEIAAKAAGWSVHSEETPAGVKWVHVGPGENGADFVHDFEFETEAWQAAAEEIGAATDSALDKHFSASDLAPETVEKMLADCAKFWNENAETIEAAIATGEVACGPDFDAYGHAAHDFWLTRGRHGCGFWDGDWPEPMAETLSAAAHAFGECDLYVGDDGKIYC